MGVAPYTELGRKRGGPFNGSRNVAERLIFVGFQLYGILTNRLTLEVGRLEGFDDI